MEGCAVLLPHAVAGAAGVVAAGPREPVVREVGGPSLLHDTLPAALHLAMDPHRGVLLIAYTGQRAVSLGGCRVTAVYRRRGAMGGEHRGDEAEWLTGGRWSDHSAGCEYRFPSFAMVPAGGGMELCCGPRGAAAARRAPAVPSPAPYSMQALVWDEERNPLRHCWSVTLSDPAGRRHQTVAASVLSRRYAPLREEERREAERRGGGERAPAPAAALREFRA